VSLHCAFQVDVLAPTVEWNGDLLDLPSDFTQLDGAASSAPSQCSVGNTNTEVMFMCNKCPYSSSVQGNFELHIRSHEVENDPNSVLKYTKLTRTVNCILYTCTVPMCRYTSMTESRTKHHSLICNREAGTGGSMKSAIRGEETISYYKCNACNFETTRLYIVKQHIESVHEKKKLVKCNLCDYQCYALKSMRKHCTLKHPNPLMPERDERGLRIYTCSHCPFLAKTKNTLNNHIKVFHLQIKKPYECSECRFGYMSHSELERHIRVEHSFYCNKCGLQCNNKNDFRAHTLSLHKKKYRCGDCDFVSIHKTNLKKHIAITHASDIFPCPHQNCTYKTKDPTTMPTHIRNKHESVKYQCHKCGETFSVRLHFTRHVDEHNNIVMPAYFNATS